MAAGGRGEGWACCHNSMAHSIIAALAGPPDAKPRDIVMFGIATAQGWIVRAGLHFAPRLRNPAGLATVGGATPSGRPLPSAGEVHVPQRSATLLQRISSTTMAVPASLRTVFGTIGKSKADRPFMVLILTGAPGLRDLAQMLSRRLVLIGLGTLPLPAHARLRRYELEPRASRAGFIYWMNGARRQGEMPVGRADFQLDPSDMAASSTDVTLRADRVRTGFFLATSILKSAAMLDTDRYPTIRFVSTAVRPAPSGRLTDGAKLDGELTIRDVTQPVTFDAQFGRSAGSAPGGPSRLTVRLTGRISRSRFGATGYRVLVGDDVELNVMMAMHAID